MNEQNFQEIGAGLLPRLDKERRKQVLARLEKMIDYAIKRQDWYEDQRNKALSLGVTLLGLASFLVGGLLSQSVENMPYFRAFAAITLLAIVGTAAWIILQYVVGADENYTHRGLASIRSWFFAYVIKDKTAKAAIFDMDKEEENKKILLEAWERFVRGWIEYEMHPNGFVIEDLQQVFVLYLFQAMRRQSLRRMIRGAYVGALIIFICMVFTILSAAFRS